ncbi:MAG: hypothetical protein HYT41_02645, partial [Candidatus Sungbacteria bacterium]|nr:hypothetical protein [Candidatus Sungbacteria bacterium]
MQKWRFLSGADEICPAKLEGFVFDIDGTLYHHPEYHVAGTCGEITAIARILGKSFSRMQSLIADRRQQLTLALGQSAT